MPRQARVDAPGALQHILVRGVERQRIFQDDADREAFLERLGRVVQGSGAACLAWALMPNHVHLLLRTGTVPLATAMRRLLTGYAVTFNHRYRRHGPLFQNRYKSILCQEEPYLLELVRYIHLNPLRGKLVRDVAALDRYPFAGHSVLMGKRAYAWQVTDAVLGQFARRLGPARRAYREFVEAGIRLGRRPELVGGGLIRSLGGWTEAVKSLRQGSPRLKGDERILGESAFVLEVLKACEERLKPEEALRRRGYDLDRVARRAAAAYHLAPPVIAIPGKRPDQVAARSLFCYWAVRELGESASSVARRLHLSQPAVSTAVVRGAAIAKARGLRLVEE
jgi:putative transposase